MIALLAQVPPDLPADPEAARLSWMIIVFVVGAFIFLAVFAGIILKARNTINSMIEAANHEVVSGLKDVNDSVKELGKDLGTLMVRDGITEAAIRGIEARFPPMENRLDELIQRVSRLEGKMGNGSSR